MTIIVFLQIHLEIDPNLYENDEPRFMILKQNDKYRLEILTDLLSTHLGLIVADINQKKPKNMFGNAYFLGRHEGKLELLEKLKPLMTDEKSLNNKLLTLKFFGKNETPEPASEKVLPILIHSCPEDFSTVEYFDVSIKLLISYYHFDNHLLQKGFIKRSMSQLRDRKRREHPSKIISKLLRKKLANAGIFF